LSICESRDPKGLYKQARDGKIREFTGISSVYEPPENPELIVETFGQSIDDSVRKIVQYLRMRNLLPPGEKQGEW
jgi:adenylylsulfate kinase